MKQRQPATRRVILAVFALQLLITSVTAAARPMAGDAAAVLTLVNAARTQPRQCGSERYAPAPPLGYSSALERAAEIQARDMANRRFIEHTGSDGSSPTARLARTGYRWRITGENLALGPVTAAEVVLGWLGSPGHCANLMEPRFTEMGLALRRARDRNRTPYWAMTLAAPR